jgi:hypothetical protein
MKKLIKHYKNGESYVDTIVKVIICVVVGALLLTSVYAVAKFGLESAETTGSPVNFFSPPNFSTLGFSSFGFSATDSFSGDLMVIICLVVGALLMTCVYVMAKSGLGSAKSTSSLSNDNKVNDLFDYNTADDNAPGGGDDEIPE